MIKDIAQTRVATIAHDDLPRLPALTRQRRNPAISPQGMIVSASKRLCCLREHRGGYNSPDSRQGTEQFDVTMPAPIIFVGGRQCQLTQDSFDALGHLNLLLMN
jgi:hypothetical protein